MIRVSRISLDAPQNPRLLAELHAQYEGKDLAWSRQFGYNRMKRKYKGMRLFTFLLLFLCLRFVLALASFTTTRYNSNVKYSFIRAA